MLHLSGRERHSRPVSILVLLSIFLFALSSAYAGVTVTAPGKSSTGTTISSGTVTITVTIGVPGPAGVGGPAPAAAPSYDMDLYDNDAAFNDAVGSDSSAVGGGSGWVAGPVRSFACGTIAYYTYTWEVPDITVNATDGLGGGNPDPTITVTIDGPGSQTASGNTATVGAPGAPPVSILSVDLGVFGPSNIANSNVLYGEPISGFSRGYDQISDIGAGANLYFVSDPATQTVTGALPVGNGQAYILKENGELWSEQAYGAEGAWAGGIRYLNVNTAADGAATATTEMYYALTGGSEIRYTAVADLNLTSSYVDLGGAPITGLAVEDNGVRGTWDAGDELLYALAGDPAI